MLEIKQDIFSCIGRSDLADGICITTNGIISKSKMACMGAGTAGICAEKYPEVRKILGEQIDKNGNHCYVIGKFSNGVYRDPEEPLFDQLLISFPTKEHFKDNAKISLIIQSSKELVAIADKYGLKKVLLPKPGAGVFTGKLNFEIDVKPKIKDIFDDRFIIADI